MSQNNEKFVNDCRLLFGPQMREGLQKLIALPFNWSRSGHGGSDRERGYDDTYYSARLADSPEASPELRWLPQERELVIIPLPAAAGEENAIGAITLRLEGAAAKEFAAAVKAQVK
ncbi:MAG: hypothetical protein K2W82_11010 [Candidatus Obscuribacterales bacterium]|nr:hypothetical protein [Candidatus Obscuribacterales bacterium]